MAGPSGLGSLRAGQRDRPSHNPHTMKWYVCAFLGIAFLTLAGCSHTHPEGASRIVDYRPTEARLSLRQAVRIATEAAGGKSIVLQHFKEPVADFNLDEKGAIWNVFFEGREAKPGNHFTVWVYDQTGETRIFGGN